ncbi:MAG: ABC transporter substrate-binding protein [Tateyamaria sp.]|uniref:ABC transporter substrate-binding protein n=1 Tax=Tateyamaria sp. TaxID=1929288 RepID=UPI00327B8660
MMNRRTVIAGLGATAVMGSVTVAIGQTKAYIPLISKGFSHQFWQAVKLGSEKAAAEFDVEVTFEGPDNEGQVDRQIDMLSAALSKNPAAIGFAAVDSQAAIPVLRQIDAAGVPVIAFDSGVASDIPVTTCTTNNLASAALAADEMAKAIGGAGKVAIISHDQTSVTGIERVDGFVNQVEAKYPDIEIVTIQYGGGDHLISTEITKSILTANPDIKGIFGANEGSAIGVLNGVTESGSDIVIIGYDSGAAQKAAVRSGAMAGAITQNPVGIGYETVKAAVATIKGETVPKVIDTGFFYYNAANMDEDQIASVLYD